MEPMESNFLGVFRNPSQNELVGLIGRYCLVWSVYCTPRFGAVYKIYLYSSRIKKGIFEG